MKAESYQVRLNGKKKKDRFQMDHMVRDHMSMELGRKSVGTLIGAISMNPGSATYLVAKRKLQKYYKEKEVHLKHPKYDKVI